MYGAGRQPYSFFKERHHPIDKTIGNFIGEVGAHRVCDLIATIQPCIVRLNDFLRATMGLVSELTRPRSIAGCVRLPCRGTKRSNRHSLGARSPIPWSGEG